jgi:hypothetical protein
MQYKSNANWILYRIDIHGMHHIVKEYEIKPTVNDLINIFFDKFDNVIEPFKTDYMTAFTDLVNGLSVEINIDKKKTYRLCDNRFEVTL